MPSTARSTRSSSRSCAARASSAPSAASSCCTATATWSARSAASFSATGGQKKPGYNWVCRPGDRGPAHSRRREESPDTTGQDAGEIPGGESRRKVEQKGDRQRRSNSRDADGKGETVG